MSVRIIELCKYPIPGLVKTRLSPFLGAEGAAKLQRKMALFVFSEMKKATEQIHATLEVCYTGADKSAFREMFGPGADFFLQKEGDLGERIHGVFTRVFQEGATRVVLTGSDCPCATSRILIKAVDALDMHDAVIGPAADGGYYLIGLKRPMPFLFENMPWSTDVVFEKTVERLCREKTSHLILEMGWDVDRPEDLALWEQAEAAAKNAQSL